MATITILNNGYNMASPDPVQSAMNLLVSITSTGNSTQRTYAGAFETLVIRGTFSNIVGGDPMAGTLNSFDHTTNFGSLSTIRVEGLSLSIPSINTWVLTNNVEALTNAVFGGADTFNGSAFEDTLIGYAGNDTMNGGGGSDELCGDAYNGIRITNPSLITNVVAGNDTLNGGDGGDLLFGGGGDDILNGDADDDYLRGNEGNDTLNGGTGNDTLEGGLGVDSFYGGDGNDTLIIGGGALVIDGGDGGLGDDIYYVNQTNDVAFENAPGEGVDTVYSSAANFSLSAGVENIVLTEAAGAGSKAIGNALDNFVSGNGFDNVLFGKDGNDNINGGGGADTMYGGAGNDAYHVDDAGDVAFESAGQGNDVVLAHISYTLRANIEDLVLSFEAGAANGTGNGLANAINGNDFANVINGAAGDDTLTGYGGADTLIGGLGDDAFVFTLNSGTDTITDFVAGGVEDTLDLSAYDGTGITWSITQVGADTLFTFTNGDTITLTNVNSASLVENDPFHYG